MTNIALWLNETFYEFDSTLLNYFHELQVNYGNILTPIARVLAVIGDFPVLLIGWLGFALFFILKDKRVGMMMCGTVIIGAFLTTIILKNIVYRPRPYLSDIEAYKTYWQVFNLKVDWDTSFPSGHACAAMGGILALIYTSKRKGLAAIGLLYPLIMGASRIYFCVHYPSDILFAYVTAFIASLLCFPAYNLLMYIFKKFPNFFLSRYIFTGSFKKKD